MSYTIDRRWELDRSCPTAAQESVRLHDGNTIRDGDSCSALVETSVERVLDLVNKELPFMSPIVAPEVAPIAIYTLDGQIVYTTSALETQIILPTGLYLVTYGSETTKVLID